jgi:hypothetical protein
MAAETNIPGGGEPPKSKLNPGKTGTGDTDKIKLSQAGQTPPKIQLRAVEAKKSTTRIDLGSVKPPPSSGDEDLKSLSAEKQAEFFKKSTIRIEAAPTPAESRRPTMRVDQAGAPTGETQKVPSETAQIDARRSTIKLDQGNTAEQADTARIDIKKTTLRIDEPTGATQSIQGETSRIDAKRSTIRIDQKPGTTGETQKVQSETGRIDVKKSTIRIDAIPQTGSGDTQRTGGETRRIDLKTVETGQMSAPQTMATVIPPPAPPKMSETQLQKQKKETTRLEIPPEVAKRQTGKIQTGPIAEPPDVFKKRTGKISTAPVGIAPVVPTSPTAIPASGSAADTVARPKTILVRRPQRAPDSITRPSAVTQVVAQQTAQARKSETARLEIPKEATAEDRPTTRPKTIRIKRPDGTTARKQLTIARPEEGSEETLPAGLRAPAAIAARRDDAPGGFWAVLAIAATLIVGALIYVLLAQTFAPTLPFPGKIG